MQELLCIRVHRAVAHTELDAKSYDRTTRLIILYACRFIRSRAYRKAVKWIFPKSEKIRNGLMSLKDDLDYSTYKNDLYRAAHHLAIQPVCSMDLIKATSKIYKLEVEDLLELKKYLNTAEKATLRALPPVLGNYSKKQIDDIIRHVDPIIRNIVFRQLAFIFHHAPLEADDLINQLRMQATKIIREYEVTNITEDHMIKNVVVGIQNNAVNIAESASRSKRQSLMRVSKKDAYRAVWYLNIHDFSISNVKVSPDQKLRVKRGDSLYVLVQDCDTSNVFLVPCKRLYETKDEAEEAAVLRKEGKYSKRSRYIDFSPTSFDEFQQTCVSIDTVANEESIPLIHKLPDEDARTDECSCVTDESKHIINNLTPKLREFAEIILDPEGNDFFTAWADRADKVFSATEMKRLGKAACDHLGLTKPGIKAELRSTSSKIWSRQAKNLIGR